MTWHSLKHRKFKVFVRLIEFNFLFIISIYYDLPRSCSVSLRQLLAPHYVLRRHTDVSVVPPILSHAHLACFFAVSVIVLLGTRGTWSACSNFTQKLLYTFRELLRVSKTPEVGLRNVVNCTLKVVIFGSRLCSVLRLFSCFT